MDNLTRLNWIIRIIYYVAGGDRIYLGVMYLMPDEKDFSKVTPHEGATCYVFNKKTREIFFYRYDW